ncbi:MAG TPA: PqiC family protein [Polyangiaceae bacterium]|jgi:hypothetical protein
MSRAAWVSLLLGACGASACGSSPPSTFYTLSPERASAQQAPFHTVKLRRPGIPGYLDRPEIVTRIVDHRLRVADTDRWAAPLDEMLGHTLAQDLQERLAGAVVFTEDGAITADADVTVEIDVRSFDVDERGQVNLVAEVAVEKGDAHEPAGARAVHLRETPRSGTTAALVSAMSDVLGKLSDEVTAMLLGRPPESLARDDAAPR